MIKMLHATAAAAILLAAVPAAAHTLLLDVNLNVPLAATLDNPCTPQVEAIVFSGTTQLAQRVWLMPDGNLRLQVAENTSLEGLDPAAPLAPKYSVAGSSMKDLEFNPEAFSIVLFKKVARLGSSDDFHSLLVMAFDPQNLNLQLGLEAACDNGMP
jgi:hypothetical protein